MAKKIFLEQEDIKKYLNKLEEDLKSRGRIDAENITLSVPVSTDERKAFLVFTQKAWIKMFALVNYNKKEVGWHGVVRRIRDSSFLVEDILVFPQEVTGTNVKTDEEKLAAWYDKLDPHTINSLRLHGHSHVNIPTNPSGTDETTWAALLNNFKTKPIVGDWFYIFLITNKNADFFVEIYDMENNARYAGGDISIYVEPFDNGGSLFAFMEESKTMVKEKVYTSPAKPAGKVPHNSYKQHVYNKIMSESQARNIPDSAVDDIPDPDEDYFDEEGYYINYYGESSR